MPTPSADVCICVSVEKFLNGARGNVREVGNRRLCESATPETRAAATTSPSLKTRAAWSPAKSRATLALLVASFFGQGGFGSSHSFLRIT